MKTTKLFRLLSVIMLGLIFSCQIAYAAGVAGRVQFVIGDVQVTTNTGNTHSLKKGDLINEGDAVSTAVSSSAQIKMQDGGFIAIRPETKMKFDKFVFNGNQDGKERGFFSLFKGGFRAVTGLIGKTNKQNYKITTAVATIGIRGTDHETYFVPKGNATVPTGVYSKVNVGETTLTTNRGTINVLPNQMGYAGGLNEVPKIAPINTHLFTVAAAPTKSIKEHKAEQAKQAAASRQGDKQQGTKQASSQGTKQESSSMGGTTGSTTANTSSSSTSSSGSGSEAGTVSASTSDTGSSSSSNSSSNSNSNSNSSSSSSSSSGSVSDAGTGSATTTSDPTSIRSDTADSASLSNVSSTTGNSSSMASQYQTTLTVPQLTVPIILTNALTGSTLNLTTLTNSQGGVVSTLSGSSIFSVAYAANNFELEIILPNGMGNSSGYLISKANLVYSAGALSSFTAPSIAGGSNWTTSTTISGGTAQNLTAPSYGSTGIQLGKWTGYTGISMTSSFTLGGTNNGSQNNWMYGSQGYIDAAYLNGTAVSSSAGNLYGTFTYSMDGGNAPRNQNTGVTGTLNSATISANFTTMLVSASLGLNIGNDYWNATLASQSFSTANGGLFSGNTSSGNVTIYHGSGSASSSTCSTCSGGIYGAFTGQNFAGAILTYNLSDSLQGNTISGDAALSRVYSGNSNSSVTDNTAAPTGYTVIDCGQGCITTTANTNIVTSSGNVLTQYSATGTTSSGANSSSSVTVNCPACTATASGQVTTSGIYYGTWTSGTYLSTNTITPSSAASATPIYWITGPEAGPLYLPQALTGTASYSFDAGSVSSTSSGVVGTVQGTTSLAVNFTNQTVAINLNASIADTSGSTHTWNAQTVAGSEAPLSGVQGIGGAAFRASSSTNSGSGLLSITVDGSTSSSNTGSIYGQLTGSGLTGAIISFNLSTSGTYADTINGVAAFVGTAQNISTPHQYVLASTYDSSALTPIIAFWANSSSRISLDSSGNITQFDTQPVNGNSNNNVTISNTGSTLTDHGTDPVTGISWGRWTGGTLNVTNRATGAISSSALTGSLHWITEPTSTTAVTLPISGTYAYTFAGGTHPTDNLGNVGTLNSATVSANFTAQTVNMGVNATVNGATLNATGTNAPIIQRTAFYASTSEPSSSSSYLTVKCTGSCGTTGGTVIGKFSGAGATGVAMSYGLQNGTSVVSGVAAFHR